MAGVHSMKKITIIILAVAIVLLTAGCTPQQNSYQVIATTKPIYDFTTALCRNTDIQISLLVTEPLSCLHDYTLQVWQMRAIEASQVVIMNGAGFEDFLSDVLQDKQTLIDASENIPLQCGGHHHESEHHEHHHDSDPHIWLSIGNAQQMAINISNGLMEQYPQHKEQIAQNLTVLNEEFEKLYTYGQAQLSQLSTRNLITFHDGFSYFAEDWDLQILHTVEEESGSEASAAELKELVMLVQQHHLPAIFVEENGSSSAAQIVAAETKVDIFILNMAMSEKDYFESMYQNIDAVKEALE